MFFLPQDYWEIKSTTKKGRGVFAKKDILPGTIIGDYLGKVIRTAEENTYDEDGNLYLMYYHDRATIYPTDIKKPGIHLLNHSCEPNCWMYTYRGHTVFFTLRHIFPGEELTVSYLISPLDKTCNPCTHICHCGSKFCTGSMHLSQARYEKWNEFNEKESEKTKRERVRYGKELPKLDRYPASIPDNPVYMLFGSTHKPAKVLTDKKIPPVRQLRQLIRESGQSVVFPALNLHVLGTQDDEIISEPL